MLGGMQPAGGGGGGDFGQWTRSAGPTDAGPRRPSASGAELQGAMGRILSHLPRTRDGIPIPHQGGYHVNSITQGRRPAPVPTCIAPTTAKKAALAARKAAAAAAAAGFPSSHQGAGGCVAPEANRER